MAARQRGGVNPRRALAPLSRDVEEPRHNALRAIEREQRGLDLSIEVGRVAASSR
jgi:hypothetical protein